VPECFFGCIITHSFEIGHCVADQSLSDEGVDRHCDPPVNFAAGSFNPF
jgi:hypothetical protein